MQVSRCYISLTLRLASTLISIANPFLQLQYNTLFFDCKPKSSSIFRMCWVWSLIVRKWCLPFEPLKQFAVGASLRLSGSGKSNLFLSIDLRWRGSWICVNYTGKRTSIHFPIHWQILRELLSPEMVLCFLCSHHVFWNLIFWICRINLWESLLENRITKKYLFCDNKGGLSLWKS